MATRRCNIRSIGWLINTFKSSYNQFDRLNKETWRLLLFWSNIRLFFFKLIMDGRFSSIDNFN